MEGKKNKTVEMTREEFNEIMKTKRIISATLTLEDITMIEEYEDKTSKSNRSDSMRDLIKIGFMTWKNIHKVQDPAIVEEIKEQLKEGGLVDYMKSLSLRDFDILASIFKTEALARGLKLG